MSLEKKKLDKKASTKHDEMWSALLENFRAAMEMN